MKRNSERLPLAIALFFCSKLKIKIMEDEDEVFNDGRAIGAYLAAHPLTCGCEDDCSECINWAIQIVAEETAKQRESNPSV